MSATLYMQRCFELARRGAGRVAPNPMVGAVLALPDRIIGEGWHAVYGGPHAEVNAFRAVHTADQVLLPFATLYCSLEPCAHYGKTPPCADLVIAKGIRHVVVANLDPNPLVAGKGVANMQAAGIRVETGVLAEMGAWLNRTFFHWIAQQRPYVVLKWAQSADGFVARPNERTSITTAWTQRLTHRWRSEVDAVLVGTHTALVDDPALDTRYFWGHSPLRIVLDFDQKMPTAAKLLNDVVPTWVLGPARAGQWQKTAFLAELLPSNWIPALLQALYEAKKSVLLVEGGPMVQHQFLQSSLWDEIRVLENPRHLAQGVVAPAVPAGALLRESYTLGADKVCVYTRMP